jgi:hypothetical protein
MFYFDSDGNLVKTVENESRDDPYLGFHFHEVSGAMAPSQRTSEGTSFSRTGVPSRSSPCARHWLRTPRKTLPPIVATARAMARIQSGPIRQIRDL